MANQKPDIDVAVGPLTKNNLKKLLDEGACQSADFNKRNEMSFSNIDQIIPFFSYVSSKIEEFPEHHNEIEEQFVDYQTMSENDIPSSTWKAAEIRDE